MKSAFHMPAFLAGLLPLLPAASAAEMTDFKWGTIQPSTCLNFTSCYDMFQCARLSVPMNWQSGNGDNSTGGTRVDIAVIRLPATVPEGDPTFGGTIVFNPGGPGGSGIQSLLEGGAQLREVASSDGANFAVLSFDPRGVGLTEPRASCFDTEPQPPASVGPLALDTDEDLGFALSWSRATNLACPSSTNNSRIFEFMSTVDVARDMVTIVDQLAALQPTPPSDRGQDQTPRIMYWGFSYGTDLGNTFASMFPGRVKRILLEGVDSVIHTVSDVGFDPELVRLVLTTRCPSRPTRPVMGRISRAVSSASGVIASTGKRVARSTERTTRAPRISRVACECFWTR